MRESIVDANGRTVALERRKGFGAPKPAWPPVLPAAAVDHAERLRDIIGKVRRLMIYDHEPHRFHEEKDEICQALHAVERKIADENSARSRQWGAKK